MIIELLGLFFGGTIFGIITGYYIGDRRFFFNYDRGLEEMYKEQIEELS